MLVLPSSSLTGGGPADVLFRRILDETSLPLVLGTLDPAPVPFWISRPFPSSASLASGESSPVPHSTPLAEVRSGRGSGTGRRPLFSILCFGDLGQFDGIEGSLRE